MAFGNFCALLDHFEKPEESPFKIIDNHGKIEVVRNTNRKLSRLTEEELSLAWNNDPKIRIE
jgi:hypothetical protein